MEDKLCPTHQLEKNISLAKILEDDFSQISPNLNFSLLLGLATDYNF
jgi:hypothetical protein